MAQPFPTPRYVITFHRTLAEQFSQNELIRKTPVVLFGTKLSK